MIIKRYSHDDRKVWDSTVLESRNGTFLHLRNYMDYHSDRFEDFSLMAKDEKGRIIAILPAHRRDTTLCSHLGLSYGGWLMTPRADMPAMMEIWDKATEFAVKAGFSSLIYKPSPHIFHKYPAEEDLYALFRHGGMLDSVLVSSVVDMRNPLGFDMASRQSVRKAETRGIAASSSDDFAGFWEVLSTLLRDRFGAKPVHSLDEITLLHSRFPSNIRLYTATLDGHIVAGVVMYISDTVAHSQYAAATPEGKSLRAMPLLYRYIMDSLPHIPYFDFGTSNEDNGKILNEGLIRQKCGFGGRAIAYTRYIIPLG